MLHSGAEFVGFPFVETAHDFVAKHLRRYALEAKGAVFPPGDGTWLDKQRSPFCEEYGLAPSSGSIEQHRAA